jgi:hypothetical protein
LQRKLWAGARDMVSAKFHRRSKMIVAGVLSVLTVAGLAMILTAWKTGLVD